MNTIENFAIMHALLALSKNLYFIGLAAIICFDYITGLAKSFVWHVPDSTVGFKGLIKHTLVIVSLGGVWVLCSALHSDAVAIIVTLMYIMNYILSIFENFSVMGIYTPKFLELKVRSEQKRYEQKLADALGVENEVQNGKSSTGQTMD